MISAFPVVQNLSLRCSYISLLLITFLTIVIALNPAQQAIGAEPTANEIVTLRIATTPEPSQKITHKKVHPGWQVEMFNAAELLAGVRFKYVFVPWDQALRLVRTGRIEAVFNSTFKTDRSVYGVYPMKDGQADRSRASTLDHYSLYIYKGAPVSWDGKLSLGNNGLVGFEKGAAIKPIIEKLGVPYREVNTYTAMLSLLAAKRVTAIAGVSGSIDWQIKSNPGRFAAIQKLEPPLQRRAAYLMFSKQYCSKRSEVCEAVWNAIGQVRRSPGFAAIRARYHGG